MSLASALPKGGGSWKKTELHLEVGEHSGYFIGLGDKIQEETQWPCKPCKGSGEIAHAECRACKGTGRKTAEKVPIRYQMAPEKIEEEWVPYTLSEPGTLKDGSPKAGSNLWKRLRAISGISAKEEIVAWYDNLGPSPRVPITMLIIENDTGDGVVIATVRPHKGKNGAAKPVSRPVESDDLFGEAEAPQEAEPLASIEQKARINKLVSSVKLGSQELVTAIKRVSDGRAHTTGELYGHEADRLIAGLEKRQQGARIAVELPPPDGTFVENDSVPF